MSFEDIWGRALRNQMVFLEMLLAYYIYLNYIKPVFQASFRSQCEIKMIEEETESDAR